MNPTEEIKKLVSYLNEQRHAYYNENSPNISDAEYDQQFDRLKYLEEKTGFILYNSPTQTVGYEPVSELPKVVHPIPLLSLDKTKLVQDLLAFIKDQSILLMLKLDGLTTKLTYENGQLIEAATRGNGELGEVITHNIPASIIWIGTLNKLKHWKDLARNLMPGLMQQSTQAVIPVLSAILLLWIFQ